MRNTTSIPEPAKRQAGAPWWRVGMVWLVIGGPLAVVVASLVTAAIAAAGADDVLSDAVRQAGEARSQAHTPAIQARNHAAAPKP